MRTNGILMPVFSLPNGYGIGDMGPEAYRFVDFLETAGQSYWQILPLNPTNYGDSPYQSFSTFAGNPYFISPDLLIKEGLLTQKEVDAYDFGDDPFSIDYGKLYNNRLLMLEEAFARFNPDEAYESFVKENAFWLDDYVLFMVLKNLHQDHSWTEWEDEYRFRDEKALNKIREENAKRMDLYRFVQYKFFQQWMDLKAYANKKHIKIFGDIPIYVAMDSADVWSDPSQFYLDADLKPVKVAGCPPDAFSEDGQLWGNPLYRWDVMAKEDDPFHWWKLRVGSAMKLYDVIRIDHFRGFEAYYTIPFGDKTAKNGCWVKGPGISLFRELEKTFGKNLPIIAEDLGYLTEEVYAMLRESGFPGMKVMQFAFGGEAANEYLPMNYPKNCVAYTGTHDNDTIMGWTETASAKEVKHAKAFLHATDAEPFNWTMIRMAMMSVADTCIICMQDVIGLGKEARINIPSTVGGNWQWRIESGCINDWLANIINEYTELYGRLSDEIIADRKKKAEEKRKAEEAAKAAIAAEEAAKLAKAKEALKTKEPVTDSL